MEIGILETLWNGFLHKSPLRLAKVRIKLTILLRHIHVLEDHKLQLHHFCKQMSPTSEINSRIICNSFVWSIVSKQAWTSTLTK
jgi:hypothetical protein